MSSFMVSTLSICVPRMHACVPRMRGAQGTGKASVPSFVVSTFSRSVCALVARILHKCTNRDGVRSSTHERMTQFVCCRLQMTGFETPSAGPRTGSSMGTVTGALEFDDSESPAGGTFGALVPRGGRVGEGLQHVVAIEKHTRDLHHTFINDTHVNCAPASQQGIS